MRELECYRTVHSGLAGHLHLEEEFLPFDRQEADRHVAVKRLEICPAFHSIFVSKLLIDHEVVIQFVVVNLTVLERKDVNHALQVAEDLVPLEFMLRDCRSIVSPHHLVGLHTMNIWRNHSRKIA